MSIARKSYIRTTGIFLFLALLALLGIVGTSLWLVQRTQSGFDEVVLSRQIRSAAADLLSVVQDAETGQRGYLVSQNPEFLEPYVSAVHSFEEKQQRLLVLLPNTTEQAELNRQLQETLRSKMTELKQTIDLAQAGNFETARAILKNKLGKALMDQARNILGDIIGKAENRLSVATSGQRANALALRWATILGAAVIVLVIAGSIYTTLQYIKELAFARVQVEQLNAGLERRVEERTQDLVRANEEVQRFAYIVTHDLRAPLVNIMGFTSELETTLKTIQACMLHEDKPAEATIKEARIAVEKDLPEAITFIRSSTRKMDALINAILKISRDGRRPLKPEQIDLKELLQATASSIHHQVAEAGGEVKVNDDIPSLVSDRFSLEQIFGNLLDNASKYSAPDRPLKIDVTAEQNPNRQIVIEVADNGRGIDAQDHQRVFDLFRRSGSQDQPGEGIGLAHVRSLVRNLGGEIALSSALGQGTTFRIILPPDLRSIPRSYVN